VALIAALILAGSAAAQEFGRVSGGELEVATRSPSTLSGSLGMALPFLSGRAGKGYSATLGGTLVNDRLWFFAATERMEIPGSAGYARMNANLGERQNLDAAFRSATATSASPALTIPSSFLSLRYTGIVSDNMFFTATISRRQ
jgi:hypothetical protein